MSVSEVFLGPSECSTISASYRETHQCVFSRTLFSVISSRGLRKLLLAPDTGWRCSLILPPCKILRVDIWMDTYLEVIILIKIFDHCVNWKCTVEDGSIFRNKWWYIWTYTVHCLYKCWAFFRIQGQALESDQRWNPGFVLWSWPITFPPWASP